MTMLQRLNAPSPEERLEAYIARFPPEIAGLIRETRATMRERLPHAMELVYENFAIFVIAYSPTERASDAIFSIAAQRTAVRLCFLKSAGLADPTRLLGNSGNSVRNIRLQGVETLDRADVRALMARSLERARTPMRPEGSHRIVLKGLSDEPRWDRSR